MEAGLLQPQFSSEEAAREYLEAKRWPDGAICPHCGVIGESFRLKPTETGEKHARKGLWKCGGCREQFTVTVGTIFEDSHIPLNKWLLAIHLLCSSKKGMSAHQLWRNLWGTGDNGKQLGSYRTAWFMAHRIRYAMTQDPLASKLNGIVEIDETFIGPKPRAKNNPSNASVVPEVKPEVTEPAVPEMKRRGPKPGTNVRANKAMVMSLVQRSGKVRSMHMNRVTGEILKPILKEVLAEGTHIMTDSTTVMGFAEGDGWKHDSVNHKAKEYVRYENGLCITTNTVEGYFSLLKKGIDGIYHHVSREHLHRYLTEFDFRYNARQVSDAERAKLALAGTAGKRLMYRDSRGKTA
jgi:hypothetical protein